MKSTAKVIGAKRKKAARPKKKAAAVPKKKRARVREDRADLGDRTEQTDLPPAEAEKAEAPAKKKKAPGPFAEAVAATAARVANGAVLGAALLGETEREAVEARVRTLTAAALAMGLKDTHRVFCELVVLDRLPQYEAYRQAFGGRCTPATARSSSTDLLAKPNIRAYCDLLRQDMARGAALDRDGWVKYMEEIMMTPAGLVGSKHRLCQKFKERSRETAEGHTEREIEVLMPNKLEAAKALGMAMGWVKEVVELHDARPEVDVEDLVKESPALQAEMARMLAAAGRK